jgi:hypothetical protein
MAGFNLWPILVSLHLFKNWAYTLPNWWHKINGIELTIHACLAQKYVECFDLPAVRHPSPGCASQLPKSNLRCHKTWIVPMLVYPGLSLCAAPKTDWHDMAWPQSNTVEHSVAAPFSISMLAFGTFGRGRCNSWLALQTNSQGICTLDALVCLCIVYNYLHLFIVCRYWSTAQAL